MGFTDAELKALFDDFGGSNPETSEKQPLISDQDLDDLLAELNQISVSQAQAIKPVLPSKQDLDALIAELDKAMVSMSVDNAAKAEPDENKALSPKELFAANRKKIESHFADTQKRRERIVSEMEADEKEPEEETEDDNESEYSKSSDSSSSDEDSSSETSSNSSEDDMPELEEVDEAEEVTAKERFAAARQKVDALFGATLQRRDQIVKEIKAGVSDNADKVQDNWLSRINVDDKLSDIEVTKLADTLKPAEEAKSPKDRFALASRNVSTLFGATLNRRVQIEKAAILAEEAKPSTYKSF